jgi:hypothetical protein
MTSEPMKYQDGLEWIATAPPAHRLDTGAPAM